MRMRIHSPARQFCSVLPCCLAKMSQTFISIDQKWLNISQWGELGYEVLLANVSDHSYGHLAEAIKHSIGMCAVPGC